MKPDRGPAKRGALWAFDIETADWDCFVLGVALADDGRCVVMRDYDDVAEWYRSTSAQDMVIAHNGGRFDYLALIDACRTEMRGRLAGGALISLRAPGHAECRDSARMFPFKLADWTGEKDTLDPQLFPCSCASPCGGYCAIRKRMSPAQWAQLESYCVQDCRALLTSWGKWIDWAADLGVEIFPRDRHGEPKQWPRATLGSTAVATADTMGCFVDWDIYDGEHWETYDTERGAYFGGRVEVFRTRATEGVRYDVNSMYPWALTQDVPVGKPRLLYHSDARRAFALQRPGLYYARVVSQRGAMPPVPTRTTTGIVWLTGNVDGWYPLPELLTARDMQCHVDVEYAWVYPREAPQYRPFIERFYAVRAEAIESAARATTTAESLRSRFDDTAGARAADTNARTFKLRAQWLKLLLNSTTGKLAQSCDGETLLAFPDVDPVGNDAHPLGTSGAHVITERRLPKHARPVHAAYLTGRARAKLHEALCAAGHLAIYCDTDASYQTGGAPPGEVHGSHLGAWKKEGEIQDWRALAPKVYRFRDESKVKVKAKGINGISEAGFAALERGETVWATRGVEGVKRALKSPARRAFVRRQLGRSLRAPEGVVGTRHELRDGRTVALHREGDGRLYWPGFERENAREVIPERLRGVK